MVPLLLLAGCSGGMERSVPVSLAEEKTPGTVDASFSQPLKQFEDGEYEKAIAGFKSGIEKLRAQGVSGDRLVSYRVKLAEAYLAEGKSDEALAVVDEDLARLSQADQSRERFLLFSPLRLLRVRILYKGKKFKEAQVAAKDLLELQERYLGSDSRELIETLNLAIASACAEDRCADTRPMILRQLALKEKYLGKEHEHVAASLAQLAELEEQAGNFGEAEKLFKRVLAIRTKSAPELVESTRKNLVRLELKRMQRKSRNNPAEKSVLENP